MSLKSLEFLNKVSADLNNKAIEMLNKEKNLYYVGVAATSKIMSELIEHEINIEKGATKPPEKIDKVINNMINKDVK